MATSDRQPSGVEPRAEYDRRIAGRRDEIARGERRALLLSNGRLAAFFLAIAVAWFAIERDVLPLWLLAVPVVAFAALVVAHARALERVERSKRAEQFCRRGLDRLNGRWMGAGADGERFLPGHPYARDLDLFGSGSVFQLLSTARTEAGEDTLARWLSAPAEMADVLARQQAVAELAPLVDFRESLAVVAESARVGRTSALATWAGRPPVGLPAIAGVLFAISGVGSEALIVAAIAGAVPTLAAAAWLAVQGAIVAVWRGAPGQVIQRINAPSQDLGVFRELLATIEGVEVASPRLAQLRSQIVERGTAASRRIARLERLVAILDQCEHNPYVRFVTLPLLLRGQMAVAIDRWHAAHRVQLTAWLQAAGEFEAFAALATYMFEHPADPFPVLARRGPLFDARALAHPLLPESQAVPNDVRLGGSDPRLLVVSGSNMSGKSTLLRAVGVNVVLALAGAPVRAQSLTLSPLALGATIRVEDSLQAGISRFYAEILRIRSIVEEARRPASLLFMLDEILHGTNSYDRRLGAEAIVRALLEAGAIGLVTTHDLALTELATRLGDAAANVHFADHIEDGKMVFDYRMRPGIVEHSNALALMRAVGLDV
jgi:hypothetical protein